MSRARDFADLASAYSGGALANRNMIINGDMAVAQRGTSKTGFDKDTSGLFHVVDRWGLDIGTTAGAFTVTQDTDNTAPLPEALKFATTTADTSIAAGEYVLLHQSIEGIHAARMRKGNSDAKPIVISFYVKGNAAATYGFGLRDVDNDRIYNDVFAVTTSWNRISISIPADTNSEYLTHDNSAALQMYIWLHGGSTYTGGTFSSKTWADRSNWNTTVNSSNTSILDSTSRTFYITGVQMELGEVATPFEHESYGANLARCQRYFHKIITTATYTRFMVGQATATTTAEHYYEHPVEMRAEPSIGQTGTASHYGVYHNNAVIACSSVPAINTDQTTKMGVVTTVVASGQTQGEVTCLCGNNNADAYIEFDAEI